MAKPQIRHLAIMARDTEELAQFYERVFEMDRLHKSKGGGVYLSDGHLTLAILPHRLEGESPVGLNHFGFKVDDLEEVNRRLAAEGVEEPKQRPAERPYAEFRGVDINGNGFDLSEHGFAEVEYAAQREKRKKLESA